MTSSALSALAGQHVVGVDRFHEYVQLQFARGDVLNVFNAFNLRDDAGPVSLDDLVGVRIDSVIEEHSFVSLAGSGIALQVDLTKDSFIGPEALHYIPTVGEQVVWN